MTLAAATAADPDVAFVADAWSRGWSIPPPMSLSEWADAHRVLPRAASSEPGTWRTDRTPYLREIMDCLSEHSPVREVNLRKGTQSGGTEVGINWVAHVIDYSPGPMMVVQPTVEVAARWSKQRFAPLLDLMLCLRAKIPPARARDSGNTTLLKEFPGGVLIISGANSSASLRSMPIRFLFLDEIDEYPDDLNDQGSAQEQAERRASAFARRKIFRVSSPTVKDASAIDREFQRGDQRYYHVPCPHCGLHQPLHIDQLLDDGRFVCRTADGRGCGSVIDEHHKTAMLAAGRWVPTHPGREVRSYHLWSAYAPIGLGYTWAEIVAMRAAARADRKLEVTFHNTILGEPYEGLSQRVEASELSARAGKWVRRTLPRGCLALTVGIDVQHNRFAVMLVGWGRNETAWLVDSVELPADPTRDEDWQILDDYIDQPIANSAGIPLLPTAGCIDSGNWAHQVYRWVRSRQAKGVMAIKGSGDPAKPLIGRASRVDVNHRGQTVRHGVQLWMVGTHAAKSTLLQRLIGDADAQPDAQRIRFPADLPDEVYAQLTAERYDHDARRWVRKAGVRNEALDCLVYAYAAAASPRLRVHVLRDADWAALEAKLEPPTADLFVGSPLPRADPGAGDPPPPAAAPRESKIAPRPDPRAADAGRTGFGTDPWRARL